MRQSVHGVNRFSRFHLSISPLGNHGFFCRPRCSPTRSPPPPPTLPPSLPLPGAHRILSRAPCSIVVADFGCQHPGYGRGPVHPGQRQQQQHQHSGVYPGVAGGSHLQQRVRQIAGSVGRCCCFCCCCCCCWWWCRWICTSAQQQLQRPTAAAAMPATTPTAAAAAAAVAAIFYGVVLLLQPLSCAGEAIPSAQEPLEVGTACRRQG